ncbi:MAG: hypothetical protein FIA98_02860 [Anaerolineae bacterium]|nr:hypothetical protein [Anaerolineae bacterium]
MRHPLLCLQAEDQKKAFIILLSLTIVIMLVMNLIGAPLTTTTAPAGIVSFELAFTPSRAEDILSSWNPDSQLRAAFIQGLDFLFPLVYSAALGLGCILAGRVLLERRKPLATWGRILAWALVVAAACDYLENIALVTELFGKVISPYPQIAGICALLKFSVIIIAIIHILYGLVVRLTTRPVAGNAT